MHPEGEGAAHLPLCTVPPDPQDSKVSRTQVASDGGGGKDDSLVHAGEPCSWKATSSPHCALSGFAIGPCSGRL